MDAYWLEQTETDVPTDDQWLSGRESARLAGLRFPKRRSEWRLGRWTAKRAVAAFLDVSSGSKELAEIEIVAAETGAPRVVVANGQGPAISLSHRAGVALCFVARLEARLGCDLELVEPRSDAFVADFFTMDEQKWVASIPANQRPEAVTLVWSAKESALKALGEGLRADTKCLMVSPVALPTTSGGWTVLSVRHVDWEMFSGWWRCEGNLLRTMVAVPAPDPPAFLNERHAAREDSLARAFSA